MGLDDRSSIARGFLFADLRGYSAFVERHGARAGVELLTAYRDLVRRTVPRFSGAEIRTEGDSFYVVFNSPSAALSCGLAILDEASRATTSLGRPLEVGIGVHAGETMALDDAYVGSAVNIAARVCAIAPAGQLLTTDAVRSLTHSYLDVAFAPVGRRRLKGISEPIVLYRVLSAGGTDGGPRVHSRLPRRLRVAGSAALLVGVVGTSIVIAAFMRQGLGALAPTATTPNDPVMTSSATAGPRSTPAESATAAGPFPTPGEQRLIALVEDEFQPSCERAPEELRPSYTYLLGAPVVVNGGVVQQSETTLIEASAAIVCFPFRGAAPDELVLWTISTSAVSVTELLLNIAGTNGAGVGACTRELPAQEAWSFGPVSGRRVCLEDPAAIYWTYDGTNVLGRATRSDGDMAALLQWWEDEARERRPS